jgi:hypothetical protein
MVVRVMTGYSAQTSINVWLESVQAAVIPVCLMSVMKLMMSV